MSVRKVDGNPEIEVVHIWTNERKWLPVEVVADTYVSVRWGLSGTYDVWLETGNVSARSIKAKRRAPCLWKSVDVAALREWVHEHLHPDEKRQREERYRHHVDNMPHRKYPPG